MRWKLAVSSGGSYRISACLSLQPKSYCWAWVQLHEDSKKPCARPSGLNNWNFLFFFKVNPGGKTLEERRCSLDAEIDSLTSILADLESSSPYKPRTQQVSFTLRKHRVGKGPASTSGVNLLSAWYLLWEGQPVPPDSIQMWLSMGRRAQLLWGGTGSKAAAPLSKGPLIPIVRLPQRLLGTYLQKMAFRLPQLSTNNDSWIKTFSVHKDFCAFIFLLFFCSVNFCLSRCQKDPDIPISWSGLDWSWSVRVAVAQQGRLEFALLCCV